MSDGKKYDGSKVRATFNGREMKGPESPTLETPTTLLFQAEQVLTVIHEDGRREQRRVTSARLERGPGELGTFVYETEPVEDQE